jgi:hypothetical protein
MDAPRPTRAPQVGQLERISPGWMATFRLPERTFSPTPSVRFHLAAQDPTQIRSSCRLGVSVTWCLQVTRDKIPAVMFSTRLLFMFSTVCSPTSILTDPTHTVRPNIPAKAEAITVPNGTIPARLPATCSGRPGAAPLRREIIMVSTVVETTTVPAAVSVWDQYPTL